jgi:hypothetical protein
VHDQSAAHPGDPGQDALEVLGGSGGNSSTPECSRKHLKPCRPRVERHVDEGGDPAERGRLRRGGEPLPLGPARLVDEHVRVDEAGEQHLVVGHVDQLAGVLGDRES